MLSKAPAFYPDIMTSSRFATSQEVIEFIGDREVSSVKDSFAALDLSEAGYDILFEAKWIYHAPIADVLLLESEWHLVATEKDLKRWTFAHGSGNVLRPELLKRNGVRIFVHEHGDETSGFIASLGCNAIGISNVFTTGDGNENLWSDITRVASNEFPGLPMVGYEKDEDLTAAIRSGWRAIGPLRVWLKTNA